MTDPTRRQVWKHSEDVRAWIDRTRARMITFRQERPPEVADALDEALEELQVSNEELRTQCDELADATTQLDAQRRRFQELFDTAPDAYIVTDQAGLITEANRAACRLLGVPIAALLRTPLPVHIAPAERQAFRAQLVRIARLEPLSEWETTVHRHRSAEVPVAITASALVQAGSDALELRWLIRDIHERKRAEANERQLQWEHAARLASEAAEQRANFLAKVSATLGTVLDARAMEQRIAEVAVTGVADYCLVDILHYDGTIQRRAAAHADPERADLMRQLMRHVPRAQASHGAAVVIRTGSTEVETPAIDGFSSADAPAELLKPLSPRLQIIVPLRARGRVLGALTLGIGDGEITTNPITFALAFADRAALALDNANLLEEVGAAKNIAERANEAKAQFLATLSHEFRTPLTAVIGYTELLLSGVPEPLPDGLRAYVERIRACGSHQLKLVEQILDYARLESGTERPVLSTVDVCAVARAAADLVRPEVEATDVTIRIECPENGLHASTDEAKLRQVLGNLVANAVKFTPAGEIAIAVEQAGDDAVFRISDTGIGIPPEQLGRIFDRFWQGPDFRGRGRGAGLGLSIAHQLVDLLGGEIGVESQPGHGTTFTVRMPLHTGPS